jgi:cytochrome c oxidase subunit 4
MIAVPKRIYFIVWLSLLVLLFATWGLAEINLHPFNAIVAMTIAVLKMLLIILYFMHVRYSSRLTWVFAGAGFLWLAILIVLSLNDYMTRSAAGGG